MIDKILNSKISYTVNFTFDMQIAIVALVSVYALQVAYYTYKLLTQRKAAYHKLWHYLLSLFPIVPLAIVFIRSLIKVVRTYIPR